MIWSDDNDPRLVQSESFRSLTELGAWLAETVAQYAPGSIGIRWTGDLLAEPAMVKLVADTLHVDPPAPPP